jgi:hypothetical protein
VSHSVSDPVSLVFRAAEVMTRAVVAPGVLPWRALDPPICTRIARHQAEGSRMATS